MKDMKMIKIMKTIGVYLPGQSTPEKFNDYQDDNDDDNDDHDYDHDNVDHQISLTGQSTPEAFTRNRLVRG